MKIEIAISDKLHRNILELQSKLGLGNVEDVTVHAWQVLRFVCGSIGQTGLTLSPEAIQWIKHPNIERPPHELFHGTQEKAQVEPENASHTEMDTKIIQEIHRLLDDDRIDQALKATQIYKLLKSKEIENPHSTEMVKPEMLFTAAETFAEECDPEKATELIVDAGHEIPPNTPRKSDNTRNN